MRLGWEDCRGGWHCLLAAGTPPACKGYSLIAGLSSELVPSWEALPGILVSKKELIQISFSGESEQE